MTGQWFSPGTPVTSTNNKTDCHNIAEILLKVALNIINQAYYCLYASNVLIAREIKPFLSIS
jgi:hypothetical protein